MINLKIEFITKLALAITILISMNLAAENTYIETIDKLLETDTPLVNYIKNYIPIVEDDISEFIAVNRYIEEWAFCQMVFTHIQDQTKDAYKKSNDDFKDFYRSEIKRIETAEKKHTQTLMYFGLRYTPDKAYFKKKIQSTAIKAYPSIIDYSLHGDKARKEKAKYGKELLYLTEKSCSNNFNYYKISWREKSAKIKAFDELKKKLEGKKIIVNNNKIEVLDSEP